MAFDQRGYLEATALADAEADMWRRRKLFAMRNVSDWFEALELPDTAPGPCRDYWRATTNWRGNVLIYQNAEDEAAALLEDREPDILIPEDITDMVLVEAGTIFCRIMDPPWLSAFDLIAHARGLLDSKGKPDRDRAWAWLTFHVETRGHDLDMKMPKPKPFMSAASFDGLPIPAREWVVEGLIPDRTSTMLSGDGGTGKSLLALQLGVAVATGTPWLGLPVEEAPVLFITAEDDMDELHRRLADICSASGLEWEDLYFLTIRSLVGEEKTLLANLTSKTVAEMVPTMLAREIEKEADSIGAKLVILDTLANFYPGDENDRNQPTQFVSAILNGMAYRVGCAVLMLAHPSKASIESGEGYSGSTAWNAAFRSRLYLKRVTSREGERVVEHDPHDRILRTMKANYGPTGGEIALRWQGGVFTPKEPISGVDRAAGNAKAERVFLKLLRLFTDQGRRVNHNGAQSYAPKLFAEHPDSEGVTKRALKTAMEGLLGRGAIKVAEGGPPSRRISWLEEVPER